MSLDQDDSGGAIPEPHETPDSACPDEETSPAAAPASPSSGRRRGASAGVLGAAMLAVGEILEPEKTQVEIVQTDDEPLDDLPFGIDFGDLPPLD